MESLRRLMSRKEDCAWKTVLNKWGLFLVSSTSSFLVDSEDWNPWREWCSSWEKYEQSHTKTPKSGKERANVWRQLNYAATITRDKLDEAMAMRQELKKQKAEVTNLQQEKLLLKTKCVLLQERLDHEQQQKILHDQCQKRELEKEVNQRQSAQKENKVLHANLQELHTKLRESSTQCRDLEYQISNLNRQLEEEVRQRQLGDSLQKILTQRKKLEYQILDPNGQLVQVDEEMIVSQNNNYSIYQKNVIIVNYPIIKRFIEGGESWHERAKRAGDGCPSRKKIWKRLQRYENPSVTLKNATYWRLVVQLSRYEDLGTKKPR